MTFDDWKVIGMWFLIVTGVFIVGGILGSLFFKISFLVLLGSYLGILVAVFAILIWMAWNDRRS